MSESKSASVVFTNGSLLAKNAQNTADSAKTAAETAQDLASGAQKTADGKNSVYRGSDPSTVPTAGLKEGDIYFTANALYTWNGTAWEETVSDTTGEEIHKKVEDAMQESQKAAADLESRIEDKVKKLDKEIEDNKIQTGNALNFYKEQYYLSTSYTELAGGSWSDEVPVKTAGKYVWSRYVTANIGDPTNHQYSDPVCISGLDGAEGPQGPTGVPGPQGPQGAPSYTHIAYANSGDGKTDFDVSNGTGKTYIGIYCDSNFADSMDPTKYTWTLIKGERGDQGIPGTKGADGQTPYFHIAYANSGDGTVDFDVSNSDGKTYIGQYTDYTQADSTNPASYSWTKIKGDTGQTGATGPQGPQGVKGDTGSTGFFIGTTPPPNPVVGTVWATNDSSGNMTSARKWNGSNWVSTAFTQDLVAGNISATKIVGGELDVNKITIKNAQNIPITSTVSLGKKLSDMEQDADGLLLTVKNNGQNLLRDTDTMPGWGGATEKVDTFTAVKAINPCTDGRCYDPIGWYGLTCIKPNTDYTLTFYARADQNGVYICSYLYNIGTNTVYKDGSTRNTLSTSYQRYEIPFHTEDFSDGRTVNCLPMRIITPNIACYIYGVQLEEGTIATAWSPSPSDVSALKVTADSLNAYVKESNGSSTLASILSMDPNNSTIGQLVNGHVVAAINLSKEGKVQIDGSRISLNSATTIPDATIKSAMIDSIDASKIKAGVLDASQITVRNLDANSITTGTLSAVVNNLSSFQTFIVSPDNTWDFDYTKSVHESWFLIGETTADHVYNGPKYDNQNKLTPYMYVTSRGSSDGKNFTVTVWKDNDPTQYQRVWSGSSNSWSNWVMLPNSQNLVSTINLSPDSVKISGKNIELDGNTRIAGGFALSADKISSGTLDGVTITGSKFIAKATNASVNGGYYSSYQVTIDNSGLAIDADEFFSYFTSADWRLSVDGNRSLGTRSIKASLYGSNPYIELEGGDGGDGTMTHIDSHEIQADTGLFGNWCFAGYKTKADGSLYVANQNGTNFDGNGSVGFQVWSGIGLGKNTIYMPSGDLYVQQGNCGAGLGASYSRSGKVDVHCNSVISQKANTVSSRLSVKTDISKVTYDRALAAIEGTEMYDYRYTSDESGQHYVSGIIDDVNPDPQYHMDGMLINKERTARIDANLVGYHHVVIQKLLERVTALEEKAK